jgi:sugar lactone lactonase YvrE
MTSRPVSTLPAPAARRDGLRRLAALVLSALAAAGCARGPGHPWRAAETEVVWPPPPEPARVRYLGVITSGELNRFRDGGFPLLRLLFGAPRLELGRPHGLAADATTLAIADSARRVVHLLDLEGGRHRAIRGAGETAFQCPIGVATDGAGGVFVADSALARVFHFSTGGDLRGEADAEFIRPAGLAYDPTRRRLHVVDAGAHEVFTFETSEGKLRLVRTLGGRGDEAGSFNFPTHAAADGEGTLYVSDSLNHRIQIFGPDGQPRGSFGRAGDGTGDFAKAKGVAVDSDGHIYVADSLYDVVQIFDPDGRLLLVVGGSGHTEGLLWLPTGVAIDGQDRIYVADTGNGRVGVYRYVRPSESD